MTPSPRIAPPSTVARPGLFTLPRVILFCALVAFAIRLSCYEVPAFHALADEHGYLTTAQRLATTGQLALHQPDPYAFIGETMMQSPTDPATYYLRQPVGYPLLCALAYCINPHGPFGVNPLLALGLLIGTCVIGRQLQSPTAGALAALVLALHPLFLYYTLKPLSHIPEASAAVWTLVAALAWRKSRHPWQALLVGLLLGIATLIRYTNILLALPILLILFNVRRALPFKRLLIHAGLVALATLSALIPLFMYHAVAFGSPFRTGYSIGGNAGSFSLAYLLDHASAMLQCLAQPSTGLTVLLAAICFGIVVLARTDRFCLWLLLSWSLPTLLLYTAYYGKPQTNLLLYARFALSSFVPLLLLAFCWISRLSAHRRLLTLITSALALAAVLLSLVNPFISAKLHQTHDLLLYVSAAADLANQHAPAGSVILADNNVHYFLDYAGPYLVYSPQLFNNRQLQVRLSDLDHTPHEFDPLRTRQLAILLGHRTDAELTGILRYQLLSYAVAGRPVFLLAPQESISQWQSRLDIPMTFIAQNIYELKLYRLEPPPPLTSPPEPQSPAGP